MADTANITVRANGPYMVQGPLTLLDAEGKEYTLDSDMIFLCRCGQSSNKPFCDGTHRKNSFQAESVAR